LQRIPEGNAMCAGAIIEKKTMKYFVQPIQKITSNFRIHVFLFFLTSLFLLPKIRAVAFKRTDTRSHSFPVPTFGGGVFFI
jgi:hypothetical protein